MSCRYLALTGLVIILTGLTQHKARATIHGTPVVQTQSLEPRPVALRNRQKNSPAARTRSLISKKDRLEVRRTVHAQIVALVVRDAALAFSYITPRARRRFKSPNAYLQKLVSIYYPLLFTEKFQFLGLGNVVPTGSSDGMATENQQGENVRIIQKVLLKGAMKQGAKQQQWMAYFHMKKMSPGKWRISECIIESRVTDRSGAR